MRSTVLSASTRARGEAPSDAGRMMFPEWVSWVLLAALFVSVVGDLVLHHHRLKRRRVEVDKRIDELERRGDPGRW